MKDQKPKKDENWILLDDSFIQATPPMLSLGKEYYVCNTAYPKRLHRQIVRERVLKQGPYGKDETNEEYIDYKKFLVAICKLGWCYVKK